MNKQKNKLFALLMLLLTCLTIPACAAPHPTDWPKADTQSRPWSRWWWMGSAVDEESLTASLSQYAQAGIGGVEICPIYGVKGYEEHFVDFLSPRWVSLLEHTMTESDRLGIGVDCTAGTGWPFGGPMVTKDIASSGVVLKRYEFIDGKLDGALPTDKEKLQCLVAVSSDGRRIDITDKIKNDQLFWIPPQGTWTLYAAAVKDGVQKVKRPAPGGEGYVLDPYSVSAIDTYLGAFDKAFEKYNAPMPRSFFHDSFEYYGANWTTDFFDQFKARRGYDLREHIEALFGDGPEDIVARVMCDYHATINDLHEDYLKRWNHWCRAKGSLSRNQAHGAPGNLIDLYAASDIPETEIFRRTDEAQIPMMKLSSSSAHLKGSTLASAESFTWLKEHYQASLADLKNATDFLFLTGVNHIFFHGIPYSPQQAPWPGWQFYASVNFGPGGGVWHGLPDYNAYVTRCQSILQSGAADNDILLYMPIYDFWQKKDKLHMTFTLHNQHEWLYPSAFYHAAMTLWEKGYTYDAVTDQFLAQTSYQDGDIVINGVHYNQIIIPCCDAMPVATMQKLIELTEKGATILFQDKIPVDVPGFGNLDKRKADLLKLIEKIAPPQDTQPLKLAPGQRQPAFLKAKLGKGAIISADLETLLKQVNIPRESAMDAGIRFERRRSEHGYDYFLVNRSSNAFDGWMILGKPAQSAVLMDPLLDNRTGWAALRQHNNAAQVYLQLQPGQSVILRTMTDQKAPKGPQWQYTQTAGSPATIEGIFSVEFIDGIPKRPQNYKTKTLTSWTDRDDKEAKRFFGTARYTITFDVPNQKADGWILDLGRVCQSARIKLNGEYMGGLWSEPFRLPITQTLKAKGNMLEIEVTNLAANLIRDLDQRNVNWKYFYDINVVNIDYKPFDASGWPLFDSGLLGPIQLDPQKKVVPGGISEHGGIVMSK